MKLIYLLTYFLSISCYFHGQNEVTYCEKTTWTKQGGTRIETYCQYGRIKNVRINKYGDTTQVIGESFDSLGRAVSEFNYMYSYDFKCKGIEINGYLANLYRDSDTMDVTSTKHIRKWEAQNLYKDTSKIRIGYQFYKGDSLITTYYKNRYNERDDDVFDGWSTYTKYKYDKLDRIIWVESIDTTAEYHIQVKSTYDKKGQVVKLKIREFDFGDSKWIKSKKIYEYDENGNQTAAYEYMRHKVVDETHNVFNSQGHCIRSFGSGYDEWEMLFERIPCD